MLTVSVEAFAKLEHEELDTLAGEDEADTRMRARLERIRPRYIKALKEWYRGE
ncbi:hypothetical protein BO71DRAFT_396617 [Aspergillus ellipticus CBS 707.79]|uniref:Uncharacterized protein n=1 Tax=Aspergillus ellipticus CBS 707.79 TaxID=1448320 RepID=A0A319DJ57_9EURO|nr:hypothetical protein BO71DRAFT_396617 [Aspergillus ellipticus CBS 707.79]